MSQPSPQTAGELIVLIESLLLHMPKREQRRFWILITDHKQNKLHHEFRAIMRRVMGTMAEMSSELANLHVETTNELILKLNKHRRPKRNVERDAEIMRLNQEGMSAGEIVRALKNRFPLTDKQVNAVISRERRKLKDGD